MIPAPTSNQWLTSPQSNPQPNLQATLRLFCFPFAGGGALTFRSWTDSLPSTVELCSIELPGRGLRLQEPAYTQLERLVQAIADAILPYLNRPFAFFGHSMGGLLSFELARLLRRSYGVSPVHLLISGRRAPQIPNANPPIHSLPESAFLAELRRLNGTPAAVLDNTELMQMLLPTLRADFAVVETYTYAPEPPFDCPITVFGGSHDPEASRDLLQAWREQTTADFSLYMLPGDHFFLHSAQPQLLELLTAELHRTVSSLIQSAQ